MSSIVSGLVGGAVAVLLTTYIAKQVGRSAPHGQLRFGVILWLLTVACLALALLPIALTVIWGHDKELWAKVALFVGFGFCAVYCFGEAAFVRGTFTDDEIRFTTPWTGPKQEKWRDLVSVELNDWCSWYTLSFKSGSKIRLSRYLSGHLAALDMAETKF
jgi:hypothetical protein